jgi:pimeloyl-ACP methyl ester carboxylesterase
MPPLWLEGRAWIEYAALLRDPIFAGESVPDGRERPVMLIPGLLAGDLSLSVMHGWLRRAGFRTLRSGIDVNIQASSVLVERIVTRLRASMARDGRKVILIGQSRGGSLAFGAAQQHPNLVERVIALGSPLAAPLDVHPSVLASVFAVRAFHALRKGPSNVDARFDRDVAAPARVPTTSIYSRTDGIVHWEACIRPDVEAFEVSGSHVGMNANRAVYRKVADLLA